MASVIFRGILKIQVEVQVVIIANNIVLTALVIFLAFFTYRNNRYITPPGIAAYTSRLIKMFAVLITFVLKAPASPRFDDTTTMSTFFGSLFSKNGEDPSSRLAGQIAQQLP